MVDKRDRMKQSLFRQALDRYSGNKFTDTHLKLSGNLVRDIATSLLSRTIGRPVLSHDFQYMLEHVMPRTWAKFRFGDEVTDTFNDLRHKISVSVQKNVEQGQDNFFEGIKKNMRMPYPICWIERQHSSEPGTTICYLVEENPRVHVETSLNSPSLRIIQFVHDAESGIVLFPGVIYFEAAYPPLDLHLDVTSYKRGEREGKVTALLATAEAIVTALLLLNCRSPIFKFEKDARLEGAMARGEYYRSEFEDRQLKFNLLHDRKPVPITFDLGRIMRRGNIGCSEALQKMQAHLVRGHFKVRKTGIFFWSHFVRGAGPELPGQRTAHRQEYRVKHKPGTPYALPDGTTPG
jgi:hypothetical protein